MDGEPRRPGPDGEPQDAAGRRWGLDRVAGWAPLGRAQPIRAVQAPLADGGRGESDAAGGRGLPDAPGRLREVGVPGHNALRRRSDIARPGHRRRGGDLRMEQR